MADPVDSPSTVAFSFPPAAEADVNNSHQLSSVYYNREFSFFNFNFGNRQKSTFEDFGFEMKEYKVNPPSAVIVMFKVYTIKREYGHKLTGLRCYDCENKVVLSVGWF